MDAYSNYILQASNARLDDLRREAAERALSKAARRGRARWWKRADPTSTREAAPAPGRCPVCLRRPVRPSTKRRVAARETQPELAGAGRR